MPDKDQDKDQARDQANDRDQSPDKASVTLPGTVEKIIPSLGSHIPEKAQITVEGADHLYREIRVENKLEDKNGKPAELKVGAKVEVTIEAEPKATTPKR
jgi:hypothetical protein